MASDVPRGPRDADDPATPLASLVPDAPLTRRRFLGRSVTAASALAVPGLLQGRPAGAQSPPEVEPPPPCVEPASAEGGGVVACQPPTLVREGDTVKATFDAGFRKVKIPGNDDDGNPIAPGEVENRLYEVSQQRSLGPSIPAPTVRVRAGDTVEIKLVNGLPPNACKGQCISGGKCRPNDPHPNCFHDLNTTNLHTHGLHISPESPSDDVLLHIPPKGEGQNDFDFAFNIWTQHPPGTHWYHPHKHGSTAIQVENGMAGALIVEDYPRGVPPELERINRDHDRVFILQEVKKDPDPPPGADHRALMGSSDQTHFFTLNGRQKPIIRIKKGEVQRWRFINAGVSENGYVNLVTLDAKPTEGEQIDCERDRRCQTMHQIAMDGIYLMAPSGAPIPPVPVKSTLLAPGNRADFLVRFDREGTYWITDAGHNRGDFALPKGTAGMTSFKRGVVRALVKVEGEMSPPMAMPSLLPVASPGDLRFLAPPTRHELTGCREVTFDSLEHEFDFGIDCGKFCDAAPDQLMRLGAVEEWTIINRTNFDHPFHIHVNPFWVFKKNGKEVANPRWQDVVSVPGIRNNDVNPGQPGSITFRTRFLRFSGKFVLHCHILPHEDFGMMQLVEVSPRAAFTGPRPLARPCDAPPRVCPQAWPDHPRSALPCPRPAADAQG